MTVRLMLAQAIRLLYRWTMLQLMLLVQLALPIPAFLLALHSSPYGRQTVLVSAQNASSIGASVVHQPLLTYLVLLGVDRLQPKNYEFKGASAPFFIIKKRK